MSELCDLSGDDACPRVFRSQSLFRNVAHCAAGFQASPAEEEKNQGFRGKAKNAWEQTPRSHCVVVVGTVQLRADVWNVDQLLVL